MKYIKINIYIYHKQKKILKISIFFFTDLKSLLIVPKGQLNAKQSLLILKVSKVLDNSFRF